MPNSNLETLLIVFIAITGLSVLMQALVLLGIFLTVRKAVQGGQQQADEFRSKLTPVLETSKEFMESANKVFTATKGLIDGLDPKLQSAATELAEMSREIHSQTNALQVSVAEVAENLRRQAIRVDSMTTAALNGLDRAGGFINQAIDLPVRQVSGVIAAARAVIETLRAPVPPRQRRAPQPNPATDEKDLFV